MLVEGSRHPYFFDVLNLLTKTVYRYACGSSVGGDLYTCSEVGAEFWGRFTYITYALRGKMAQSVESVTRNLTMDGSTPTVGCSYLVITFGKLCTLSCLCYPTVRRNSGSN